MTALGFVEQLSVHIRTALGDGPFPPARGWTRMGAVICDASFHAQRKCELPIRLRLLRLQAARPDAATVCGFRARLATEDLADAMDFKSPRRVATAHSITDLLAADGEKAGAYYDAMLAAKGVPGHTRIVP